MVINEQKAKSLGAHLDRYFDIAADDRIKDGGPVKNLTNEARRRVLRMTFHDPRNRVMQGRLKLYEGMPVILRYKNLSVPLGITNGAQGVLRELSVHRDAFGEVIGDAALVEFPHSKVNIKGLPPKVYPVEPLTCTLVAPMIDPESGQAVVTKFSRRQLPIEAAFAVTGHSAQGKTLPVVICDPTVKDRSRGFYIYVSFSRARNLDSLAILNEVTLKILNQPLPPALKFELRRLAALAHNTAVRAGELSASLVPVPDPEIEAGEPSFVVVREAVEDADGAKKRKASPHERNSDSEGSDDVDRGPRKRRRLDPGQQQRHQLVSPSPEPQLQIQPGKKRAGARGPRRSTDKDRRSGRTPADSATQAPARGQRSGLRGRVGVAGSTSARRLPNPAVEVGQTLPTTASHAQHAVAPACPLVGPLWDARNWSCAYDSVLVAGFSCWMGLSADARRSWSQVSPVTRFFTGVLEVVAGNPLSRDVTCALRDSLRDRLTLADASLTRYGPVPAELGLILQLTTRRDRSVMSLFPEVTLTCGTCHAMAAVGEFEVPLFVVGDASGQTDFCATLHATIQREARLAVPRDAHCCGPLQATVEFDDLPSVLSFDVDPQSVIPPSATVILPCGDSHVSYSLGAVIYISDGHFHCVTVIGGEIFAYDGARDNGRLVRSLAPVPTLSRMSTGRACAYIYYRYDA